MILIKKTIEFSLKRKWPHIENSILIHTHTDVLINTSVQHKTLMNRTVMCVLCVKLFSIIHSTECESIRKIVQTFAMQIASTVELLQTRRIIQTVLKICGNLTLFLKSFPFWQYLLSMTILSVKRKRIISMARASHYSSTNKNKRIF